MLAHATETRISWFRLFADLKSEGWTLYDVVKELKISKSTLLGWKMGVEPKHADGERLIELWSMVTAKDRAVLPVERRYPNAFQRTGLK